MRIILGAGFSGGVLAFALGCSSGGAATTGGASSGAPSAQAKTSTSSASAAPASAAARDTLKVGDPAPDVVFSFTDGTTASLASLSLTTPKGPVGRLPWNDFLRVLPFLGVANPGLSCVCHITAQASRQSHRHGAWSNWRYRIRVQGN